MKTVECRYLSQKDVMDAGLTMENAISIVEEVLKEHGLKEVLPRIEEIKIFDTNESVLAEFISHAREHGSLNIISCASARGLIEGANVVVTATGHLEERVYKDSWIKKGALVLPVHTRGWEKSMLGNSHPGTSRSKRNREDASAARINYSL